MYQYNNISFRDQSGLCFTRHSTFVYFHRIQLSVLVLHAVCFHRWITFFSIMFWLKTHDFYALSIGYQGCVLVFLLSVFSFYPLMSYLWGNTVLCSPAAVGIVVVTLGKWHVMFCSWYIFFRLLSRSPNWGLSILEVCEMFHRVY